MDANPFVLDISSDEEPVTAVPPLLFDEDPPQPSEEDFEWLREFLLDVDKEKEGQEQNQPRCDEEEEEDSDEVVILGEYYNPPKPKRKRKRPGSKSSVLLTDDDDDCVVLDGDPDDPAEVNDGGLAGGDGDELLVVGQKGQIACRDYAHSRHLCFKFPFNSSPHDGHCKLCHCYVCDIPAPCAYWGTGVSNGDHCHATDKEERWKSQRENFRLGKDAPLAAANATIPVSVTQINQISPVRLPSNLVPQNMVSRPITVRPCSSPIPFGVPNTISQCRDQESVQRRNGLVPRAVLPQALGICHNLINQHRGPAVSNTNGQFISSSNAMFKRSGAVSRALATSQSVHGQSYRRSLAPVSQYARDGAPLASSLDKNTGGKQDALANIVSESFRTPTNSVMGSNAFGSELSGHGVSQSNHSVNAVGNRSQNDKALVLSGINFDWLIGESNQEMSEGNIQLQNTWTNNEPLYDKQSNSQLSGGSHYENWFSRQSIPVPSEDLAPCLNVFPSEPPAYDASMLCFDFETSWKSVTHA